MEMMEIRGRFQDGLKHLFLQGQNLRKLYVETGILNGSYDSEEVI